MLRHNEHELNAWIAAPGYEDNLIHELLLAGLEKDLLRQHGSIFYGPALTEKIYWAIDTWFDVRLENFTTTGDAANILKRAGTFWSPLKELFFHRTSLIESRLAKIKKRPLEFPVQKPILTTGMFALLNQHSLIFASKRSNPFPGHKPNFIENKTDAPSRAYLKLWEALTRSGKLPRADEQCLDVGASPGGWTWVMANLGCHVTAVDRSELTPGLMQHPLVHFKKGNAFQLLPEQFDKLDWLISDLICEPKKLYDWIQLWIQSGKCHNYICTLKMKGQADFKTTSLFANIPDASIVHLFHNKHELTWMLLKTAH